MRKGGSGGAEERRRRRRRWTRERRHNADFGGAIKRLGDDANEQTGGPITQAAAHTH